VTASGEGDRGGVTAFREVAAGVHVLRYPVLDVNVTLVVGDGAALLVDTLSTRAQALELLDAVRVITAAPLVAVNTHHHFDHCFGNATVAATGATIWGHTATAARLRARARWLPRQVSAEWMAREPALAGGIAEVTVVGPDRTVAVDATVDVGGRPVTLYHPGPAHTDGDLVVWVPDAGVVVAGDLVEEGADPQFDDGFPLCWPDAVGTLLERAPRDATVVPGHGAVVDRSFVTAQHAELSSLARLIRAGYAAGLPAAEVAATAPFGTDTAVTAIRRGYAELATD
jgi:glyoxylase-like metal-dependent hydrolase (beta-lactamase superfamily II)